MQKAGVPFQVCFVAKNNGGDGHVTAQIMEGDTVLAEKFVAVDGGQFRVITMEFLRWMPASIPSPWVT